VSPWILVAFAVIGVGGLVTLLKGRLAWFLIGFIVGGLIWPITAWLPATPDSPWAARFGGGASDTPRGNRTPTSSSKGSRD
jgi:hypothetical protein